MNCKCDNCGKFLFDGRWWDLNNLEYCPKCGMEITAQKMKEIKKARNLYCFIILLFIIVVIIYTVFTLSG
ncbi:MAG: hypothetical protein ACFFC3_08665 [Candidatus Odinarchaeota archaeon]